MNPIDKIAYPVGGEFLYVNPPHNIEAWMNTLKHIYVLTNKGMDFNKALDVITEKWDNMDKRDFKNWIAFYQQGGHTAYKKAELEKNAQYMPGAFLDMNELRSVIPGVPTRYEEDEVPNQEIISQKTDKQRREEQEKQEKEYIDQQIKALIGRLNAAERIATTRGIDKALGPVYENWLKALHDLKREIQVAPFRTVKSSLLIDLIVRKGNQLFANGYEKSAQIMYKLAQVAPPPLENVPELPAEPSLETTTDPATSEMPTELPNIEPSNDKKDEDWVEEFLNGLNGIVDSSEADDELSVSDGDLTITAQAAPVLPASPVEKAPVDLGSELEQALAHVTIDEVIGKLEVVSNIFKNREISRQLAMVDIMMDQLGISSFFPELAEATSKSLESNQYCSTRVEDILGRLKGSVNVPADQALDLEGNEPGAAEGNAVNLKNQLNIEKQKEDARKKSREEASEAAEDAAISNKQAPQAVNTEALNQPTEVQAPTAPGVRV